MLTLGDLFTKKALAIFSFEEEKDYYIMNMLPCENPYCDCGQTYLFISDENNYNRIKKNDSIVLSVNVHDEKIFPSPKLNTSTPEVSVLQNQLSDYFKEGLTADDWSILSSIYYDIKGHVIEEFKSTNYDYEFSQEHITDSALLIYFSEIFPASQKFMVERNGDFFYLEESYCKNEFCDCMDIYIEVYKNNVYDSGFWYNYGTGEAKNKADRDLMDALNKTYNGVLNNYFLTRNLTVRMLYAKSNLNRNKKQLKQNKIQLEQLKKSKTRRNDPCYCGSGKKYKYCCLKKGRVV